MSDIIPEIIKQCKLSESIIYLLTKIVESDPKNYQSVYEDITSLLGEKYSILKFNESKY
jgi:hypothetical protein